MSNNGITIDEFINSLPNVRIETLEIDAGEKFCLVCKRFVKNKRSSRFSSELCGSCSIYSNCIECNKEILVSQRALRNRNYQIFCNTSCSKKNLYKSSLQRSNISKRTIKQYSSQVQRDLSSKSAKLRYLDIDFRRAHSLSLSKSYTKELRELRRLSFKLAKPNWSSENSNCKYHTNEKLAFIREQYLCWGCIKVQFYSQNQINFSIPEMYLQNTYRLSHNSSIGQFMMEQELCEKNIGWFTYIKGFTLNKIWSPLVVGKTGSKLVNKSGTDISFQYSGNNLARSFLRESNLNWDTSKVLICPHETEQKALENELYLAKKFQLLYS